MLHEKPVQYNRPDGTGIGDDADAGSGEWTGKKKRKPLASSDSPPAQGDQEDPFFTAEDLEDFIISRAEEMEFTRLNKKKAFVFVDLRCTLDDESQRDVYERLVLYRLKAHKLSKGESIDKLDDDKLKTELGNERIFQLPFDFDNYFTSLEEVEGSCVDWYFDPEFSKLKDLANYQRLVLKNHDDVEYLDWKGYRLNFCTYQMDKEYVKFVDEMSKKLQYIGTKGTCEWLVMEIRGLQQALKLATRYVHVPDGLVITAFMEHIWSLHDDYLFCEDWDIIFLKIWKLVTKKKWEFMAALMYVKKKKYVRRHDLTIRRFLRTGDIDLKLKFDLCVEGIPRHTEDRVAQEMIKNEIFKLPRKKTLYQYKVKKTEIAERIGLDEDPGRPKMATYRERRDGTDIIVVIEAGQPLERADPGSHSSLYPVKYA
ncbi:unnamed protein product [Alopecurus aequalis]